MRDLIGYLNSFDLKAKIDAIIIPGVTSVFGRTGVVVAAANDYTFAQLASLPTTISGYGITDPIVYTSGTYSNPSWITTLAWSKITGSPTTLSGYGITDAYPLSGNPSGFLTSTPAQSFASLTGKPTTIAGYGITDYNSLGDARWAPIAAIGANPSASVGLAAINGSATTWMRSDGAPALSQSIAPTWSGIHTFSLNTVFSTSMQSPLFIGGTGTTSTLIHRTTSGVGATGARHIFQVGNNGATEAATILNNGNMGIGVVSPGEKLQVNGAIKSTGTASTALASSCFMDFTSGGMRLVSYGANTSTRGTFSLVQVSSSGTILVTPMFSDVNGNIGIGTLSPTSVLHIKAGTATAGTAPLKLTAGTNISVITGGVNDGAFEYDGTHLYFTIGSTRNTII